jgi:hypothetical protein
MKLGAFLGVSMLGVIGLAHTAQAAPGWCSAVHGRIQADDVDSIVASDDPREALPSLVGATCAPDGDAANRMADLDAARASWSKKLGLTEADWADVAAYAQLEPYQIGDEVVLKTGDGPRITRAWSSFAPMEQYAALMRGAGDSSDLAFDHDYLADAFGAQLSEAGRLAYIRDCITSSNFDPVHWAMCQPDIDQLDGVKLASEVRADTVYGGADKTKIRVAYYLTKAKLVEHAARIKKLIASDPGYGKLFEIAAATHTTWVERATAKADLLALVAKMDDARATNSRAAYAGCEDTTWAAWTTAVSAVPAKSFAGIATADTSVLNVDGRAAAILLKEPEVYLAAVALQQCDHGHDGDHDYLHRVLGGAMLHWPGARGQRTETQTRIMTAGIEFDNRDTKLAYPGVNRSLGGQNSGSSSGGIGEIAKITPKGAKVHVEFKPKMVKEEVCTQVAYSNRIAAITAAGTVLYEGTCLNSKIISIDRSSKPLDANARYMKGMKAGMFIDIGEDSAVLGRTKGGGPVNMVFGVQVK